MRLLYNCGHQVQQGCKCREPKNDGKHWLHLCRGSSVERTKLSCYFEVSVVQIINTGNKPAMFNLETFWKLVFQLSAKDISPQKKAWKK